MKPLHEWTLPELEAKLFSIKNKQEPRVAPAIWGAEITSGPNAGFTMAECMVMDQISGEMGRRSK